MGRIIKRKTLRSKSPLLLLNALKNEFAAQHAFSKRLLKWIKKGKRLISVTAPVKCGKRIIKQIIGNEVLWNDMGLEYAQKFLVTGLVRIDTADQVEELVEIYGFNISRGTPFSKSSTIPKKHQFTPEELEELVRSNPDKRFLVCFDETDFGTAVDGRIGRLILLFKEAKNLDVVFFSATPQELEHSQISGRKDFKSMKYVPTKDYRGAEWFLANGKVVDLGLTETFVDRETLEMQKMGYKAIDHLTASKDKLIGVTRLPTGVYSDFLDKLDNDDSFWQIFESRGIMVVGIDSKENTEMHKFLKNPTAVKETLEKYGFKKMLVVLNQCFTRSAEIHVHHLLAFWFEQRNKVDKEEQGSTLATVLQSVGRCFFYVGSKYPEGSVDITIFTSADVLHAEVENNGLLEGKKTSTRSCKPNRTKTINPRDYQLFLVDKEKVETREKMASFISNRYPEYEGITTSKFHAVALMGHSSVDVSEAILKGIVPESGTRKDKVSVIFVDSNVPSGFSVPWDNGNRFEDMVKGSDSYQELCEQFPDILDASKRGKVPFFIGKPLPPSKTPPSTVGVQNKSAYQSSKNLED